MPDARPSASVSSVSAAPAVSRGTQKSARLAAGRARSPGTRRPAPRRRRSAWSRRACSRPRRASPAARDRFRVQPPASSCHASAASASPAASRGSSRSFNASFSPRARTRCRQHGARRERLGRERAREPLRDDRHFRKPEAQSAVALGHEYPQPAQLGHAASTPRGRARRGRRGACAPARDRCRARKPSRSRPACAAARSPLRRLRSCSVVI